MAGVTLGSCRRATKTRWPSHDRRTDGRATFAPGLLRGSGGREAVLLKAHGRREQATPFSSLTGAAFDLADRGAGGRPAPGPVDAYLYTDRGIYRPGETVHLIALVRDDHGRAIGGLPARPDRGLARTASWPASSPCGAIETGAVPLRPPACRQRHHRRLALRVERARRSGATVGETTVQVEDFVPPRIEVKRGGSGHLCCRDRSSRHRFRPLPVRRSGCRPGHQGKGSGGSRPGALRRLVRLPIRSRRHSRWFLPAPTCPMREPGTTARRTLSLVLPGCAGEHAPAASPHRSGGAGARRPAGRHDHSCVPCATAASVSASGPGSPARSASGAPATFEIVLVGGAGEARRRSRARVAPLPGGAGALLVSPVERTLGVSRDHHRHDRGRRHAPGPRTPAPDPSRIALQAAWGDYRLEVTDPGNPGALPASTRFRVGWGEERRRPGHPRHDDRAPGSGPLSGGG